MLSAAFDASGSKHDKPILVVAGFIASVDDWIDFDKEWKSRLDLDNVAYFHANEFAHSIEQFDGWRGKETKRRALYSDLIGIIQGHCHRKFGCLIINSIHDAELSVANRESFNLEAYALAGRTVVADVSAYAASFHAKAFPEIIFEDGDLDKGKLIQRMKDDGYPAPSFKPKKDTSGKDGLLRPGYTPLQAADLWAYELFQADMKVQRDGPQAKFRWGFEQLHKISGEAGFYSGQT
jgi:hypothetical protein